MENELENKKQKMIKEFKKQSAYYDNLILERKKEEEKNKTFYETREWLDVRYRALLKSKGVCNACGAERFPLHVDHIKPRSKYPELELDLNNLQVLCKDCNLGKSNWDETDWRK